MPGEGLLLGGVSQNGNFVQNSFMTTGEFDGYQSEFFGLFEQQKRVSFQKINRLLGDGGTVDLDLLREIFIEQIATNSPYLENPFKL